MFGEEKIEWWSKDRIQEAVNWMARAIGPSFAYWPEDQALLNPRSFILNNPCEPYQNLMDMAEYAIPMIAKAGQDGQDLIEQYIGFTAWQAQLNKKTHCKTFHDVVMTARGYFYLRSWEASWKLIGFPRVVLSSHTYAASLMSTVISPQYIPEIIPPWDSFSIDVPTGIVNLSNGMTLRRVRLFYQSLMEEKHWNIFAEFDNRCIIRLELTPEKLTQISEMETERAFPDGSAKGVLLSDEHERVMTLVGRLVLNVCLAMTDKERIPYRHIPTGVVKGRKNLKAKKYPPTTAYTLGSPVKIDCRPSLHSFMEGRSSGPLTVQRLVAGHWKMQPHGPHNSLRRWQHIEPYWQGDSDAPIVVKPHVFKEEG